MRIVAALAAVLLLAPAQSAHAQASDDGDGDKSPALAFGLSVAGTAAGGAVLVAALEAESLPLWAAGITGVVVGPSVGQLYGGAARRGLVQMALRLGAAGAIAGGAILAIRCDDRVDCSTTGPAALMIAGGMLALGSTLYSIGDAGNAAEEHNAEARQRRVVIAPAPLVGPERSVGYGVELGASF